MEDRGVSAPWCARLACNWFDLRDRLSFRLQIYFRVPIRRGRAGMTKIVTDRRQVDAGRQERHGRTVPHAVGMKPLFAEIRNIPASTGKAPGEDVADSKSGQGFVTVVQKHVSFRPQIQVPLLRKKTQDCGSLRPQRTVALFPSFAEQSHLKGLGQLEVAGPQVSDLLHTSPRVEHRG